MLEEQRAANWQRHALEVILRRINSDPMLPTRNIFQYCVDCTA